MVTLSSCMNFSAFKAPLMVIVKLLGVPPTARDAELIKINWLLPSSAIATGCNLDAVNYTMTSTGLPTATGNSGNTNVVRGMVLGGNVTVDTASAYNLGSAAAPLNQVYANTFNGTLQVEPTIDVTTVKFPYSGSTDFRLYDNAGVATLDNGSGGAATLTMPSTSAINTGTVTTTTAVKTPSVDRASAGALSIGTTTATSVSIGSTSAPTTMNGATSVGPGYNMTVSGGGAYKQYNSTSDTYPQFNEAAGAINLGPGGSTTYQLSLSGQASTPYIVSGNGKNFLVDAAAVLDLGTSTATSVSIGGSSTATTVNGNLTCNGEVYTQYVDTPSSETLYIGSNNASAAYILGTGGQTTFGGNVNLGAASSLAWAGGPTMSRPSAGALQMTGCATIGNANGGGGGISAPYFYYNTGTISQSGTTVTGTGTSFTTNNIVGGLFIPATGNACFITSVASATSMTVDFSQTISAGTSYNVSYGGSTLGAAAKIGCQSIWSNANGITLNPNTGNSVVIGNTNGSGLQIANSASGYVQSTLSSYESFTYNTTWGSGVFNSAQTANMEVVHVGDHITVCIPVFSGTISTAGVLSNTTALPARVSPARTVTFPCQVLVAGSVALGLLTISTSGVLSFGQTISGSNFTTGTCGLSTAQTFTYTAT
jgi:hypothetical protein